MQELRECSLSDKVPASYSILQKKKVQEMVKEESSSDTTLKRQYKKSDYNDTYSNTIFYHSYQRRKGTNITIKRLTTSWTVYLF